jgi:hypothetical protein
VPVFVFVCFFSFSRFLLVLFRSWFSLVFRVFTGLDVCSNLKYVQFLFFFLIFEFFSNSKIVQIQKLFKCKFCSNSNFVQTRFIVQVQFFVQIRFIVQVCFFFKFDFCSNLKFVQIKICSYSKFIQILILFTNLFKIRIFRKEIS